MAGGVTNFRDLIVWQKAMRLVIEVDRITRQFPREGLYVLTGQIRRAAISIPSNTAEGHARRGREFANYLSIALGSAAELETQLLLAAELGDTSTESVVPLSSRITEIRRIAAAIANKIRPPRSTF